MERKITKIGNNYGITIPTSLLKEADISYGDYVRVELEERKIVLQKKNIVKLPRGERKLQHFA